MSVDKPGNEKNHDNASTGEQDRVITIAQLSHEDLPGLRQVLESAVVNPVTKEPVSDEIEELLLRYKDILDGDSEEQYFVAHDSQGQPIGVMGLAPPDAEIRSFTTTDNPIEIVNAYILSAKRGVGVGSHLVRHLEMIASLNGYTEVVLNSGPRYRWSGWPFWTRMFGEPIGIAEKYYDGEWDAMVWHHEL
jgi:GNAT superfamily N-acetyltransferase